MNMQSSPKGAPKIQVRDRRFDTSAARVPRHWLGGRKAVTRFMDNLSIFFPAGERFFVASVRAHEKKVEDPELLAAVRAFVGQEGIHTREHLRYNEMLRAQGLPISEMEERVRRLLSRVTKWTPRRRQLAVTCALEHFTALLGHVLLEDDDMADAAPEMAALWQWHAAEENEHKAVAFDLYRAVGGRYRERVLVMLGATVIFWLKVAEHQVRLMSADDTLLDPREWADLASFLFVSPGPLRRLAIPYLHYMRPSFHPNDLDASAALARFYATCASPTAP